MYQALYIIAYAAIAVFMTACVVRIITWSKMPMHVRWELYPVAHEAKKAHYGGSYLEEPDWWEKPRQVSLLGELKVMIPEILFLVALKENNPKLWLRSFLFHFGLYLVIGCTAIMMIIGIFSSVVPETLNLILHYATLILGVGGLFLSTIGAIGLLQRRLSDSDLKNYTAPADIFNLIFFVITFGCAIITFLLVDRDFSRVQSFISNLVAGDLIPLTGSGSELFLPIITIILMGSLLVYIPLTHMSHFIGKYFAYHSIRWNDKPNLRNGPEEKIIGDLLARPVSWAAPHIGGDGKKTWADVATDISQKEDKE